MNYSNVKCSPIEKLLAKKVPPVLFVGSGFSIRYLVDYPNWLGLLEKIAEKLNLHKSIVKLQYNLYTGEGKSDGEAKQHIGSFLQEKLDSLIKSGQIENGVFTASELDDILLQRTSSFKYLVAKIFKGELNFKTDKTYYKTERALFQQLYNIVPAILTTNYDRLLENIFPGFKPYIEQSDYFYSKSVSCAEIYKIHGCISAPNTMVITHKDYEDFNERSYLTVAKIISLLCHYPMMFIGYSLSDENIKNILESIVNCLSINQLNALQENLIFIERVESVPTMNSYVKEIKLKNKTLKLTYVETDNFTRLFRYLNQFKQTVTPLELRKFYSTIRNLIVTQSHKLKDYICNLETNLAQLEAKDVAVAAIGLQDEAAAKYPKEKITLDVLLQKYEYAADKIINIWLTQGWSYNTFVPIYYYYKQCKLNKIDISTEAKDKFSRFKANTKIIRFNENKNIDSKAALTKFLSLKKTRAADKICALMSAYKGGYIRLDDFRKLLIEQYNFDNSVLKLTEFRKAVVMLDKDENKI